MLIRKETFAQKSERMAKWHLWYAWHPVWFDGGFAWFEYLERKAWWGEGEWYKKYRPVETKKTTVNPVWPSTWDARKEEIRRFIEGE